MTSKCVDYSSYFLSNINQEVVNIIYLLLIHPGLFSADHMEYELLRHTTKEPSLADMTEKAIEVLQQKGKKQTQEGYSERGNPILGQLMAV